MDPFFFYTGHRQPPSSAAVGNFNHHHEQQQQQPDFTNNTQVLISHPYKEEMFEKPLTPSDVGKLNRLVIPKQHAETYFPLLASDQQQKGLLLSFEDADDDDSAGKKLWRFRYSYWNSSQSYVLTKGWSRYVKDKSLDAGDVVFFHRNMHTMFIGCRRRRSSAAGVLQDMMAAHQPVGTAAEVSEWSSYDAPHELNYIPASSSPHPPPPALPYQHDYLIHAAAGDVENYKREAVAVATRRGLRLFGVNLECPDDDSEPSTSYGSSHGGQSDHII